MRNVRHAMLAIAIAAAAQGCGQSRDAADPPDDMCTRCHGGTDNLTGAPPHDLRGNTDPSVPSVGRHSAHMAAGMACVSCHPARPELSTPGHMDGKVDVVFGGIAVAGGAAPVFDAQSVTCSNVYCHGATLDAGGARPQLVWTGTLGTPRCAQCHGAPPPAPHPQVTQCASCHPATVNADGSLVPGGKHLNGQIDVVSVHPAGYADRASPAFHGPDAIRGLERQPGSLDCTSCHGATFDGAVGPSCNECHAAAGWVSPPWTANCTFCHGAKNVSFSYATDLRQAAPPSGVAGETSGPQVGAHQVHLAPTRSKAVACTTCHTVPSQSSALAHIDGTAAVTFSAPASGAYDPQTQTCAVSCHGANPSPTWTTTGPLACDTCHGAPPATGRHPAVFASHAFMGTNCVYCHAGVAAAGPTIVDPTRHVNGVVDVNLVSGTYANGTCTTSCHGPTAPPQSWQ